MRRSVLLLLTLAVPCAVHAGEISELRLTQAALALDDCRVAQREAEARAARGELSLSALLTFRRATEKARAQWVRLRTPTQPVAVTLLPVPNDVQPALTTAVPQRMVIIAHLPAEPVIPPARAVVEIPVKPSLTVPPRTLAQSFIIAALPGPARQVTRRVPFAPVSVQPGIIPSHIVAAPPGHSVHPQPAVPEIPPAVIRPAPVTDPVKPDDATRMAQLETRLGQAEQRLNQANAALSDGQKQLAQFTATLRAAMLEAGPEATGLHPFVRVAEKYAGTPYVWGGESRGGFDCSGLIILVMRELGYKTPPHSAAEQFKYGKPIAQQILKPGDLVFFANTYKPGISHVGIYLGKRHFIHAAGTGKGTIVSSLDEAKFQAKFAGARRLVPAH